ncbi:MAG TPA: phenylalanine--tRNA ligase subunit beta, partial [Chthoniobacterales bacterium]
LLISEEGDGLLILSPEAKVGAPLASIYQSDTILDVEITPNRGDLLSHRGLAREIAALTGKVLQQPHGADKEPVDLAGGVDILATRECPFYSLRRIEKVEVAASPDWMRAKLEAAGMRAINNIVDISNYVMLELGQPTHAFDADKIRGAIHVRLARAGEKFLALDGKTYTLSEQDLVIADDERVVGIAGVMGGEDTGVSDSTRNILLEAAYFLPSSIRRTARTLNLPSDASYRFERSVDPRGVLNASARATGLMAQVAAARPNDSISIAGTPPAGAAEISIRYQRCNDLLGTTIAPAEVMQILDRFGLHKTQEIANVASTWKAPSYRPDLRREVDLIEEVVRAYGLEKIPANYRSRFTPQSGADRVADYEASVRQRLIALGLFEARTSALIPRAAAAQDGAVALKNPLSEDHVALRPSIVRGLLDVLARNVNMGATSIRLFELGNIFTPPDAKEQRALGLVLSGAAVSAPHWRGKEKRQLDFFDLKGAIDVLRIPNLGFRRTENAGLALAAEILSGEKVVGLAGQLRSERGTAAGASAAVFVAQIVLDALGLTSDSPRFSEIDKFPAVTRDIAMIVPETLAQSDVVHAIEKANEPLVADVRLFDLFAGSDGGNIPRGQKSLAYTLTYRDRNRTLTNDEVTVVHTRIRERLKRELGAELRE